MSDFMKEELQVRLGSSYQNYANLLESWCRGQLSWEQLEMMVAQMLDPATLELHNEYINSMVSRLESDPTVSDAEPPKKRARELHATNDLFDLTPAQGDLMMLDEEAALAAFDLNDSDLFGQAGVAMDTGHGEGVAYIEGEPPWCGPPPEEEDGPSLCTRLGRLPSEQELGQRLMAVAACFKLSQVANGAVEQLNLGLNVFIKACVQHVLLRKLPFRCSQNFRLKPPFCNEPHPLHERLRVNPVQLQQQKLFTRRPSAETHVAGSCDLLCPDGHLRAINFFPRRSRNLRSPERPLAITLGDLRGLVTRPLPSVVSRAGFQTAYQLLPETRNREAVQHVLLNSAVRSPQDEEVPHPAAAVRGEMDESDEEGRAER